VNIPITVVILTLNEAPNISRVLEKLALFSLICVVDSGSTDDTKEICERFPNVRFFFHRFENHQAQWQFGVECAKASSSKIDGVSTGLWVLTLDADYVLSDALIKEIQALNPPDSVAGYAVKFQFWIDGAPVPASLYPPRTVLFRAERAEFVMRGHTQILRLDGSPIILKGLVYHDDRKSWQRFINNQRKYAILEAAHLRATPWTQLRVQDKIRSTGLLAPWLVPIITYLRVWPAGRRALKYCAMRFTSEVGIAKNIWQMRFASVLKRFI
jgi:glycosyltransferase involved in cell wall biosynthesis